MSKIEITEEAHWDWVKISLGRGNAVGPEFLNQLDAALKRMSIVQEEGPARPIILTGYGDFFSAGLDISILSSYNREELNLFLNRFQEVFLNLACCPRPTVAAVNGHAVGAGCLLLLACDRRIAEQALASSGRPYHIGMKVSALGVPLPPFAATLVRTSLESLTHRLNLTLTGDLFPPGDAQQMGMVDRVAGVGELREAAEKEAARLTHSTGRTAALLKSQMKLELYQSMEQEPDNNPFLDAWYSAETQRRLGRVLEKLHNNGKGGE